MASLTERLKTPASRFILLFIGLVLVLNLVISIGWIDHHVIFPYTKAIAAIASGLLSPLGYDVSNQDTIIRSSTFAVDIRRGCDGVVATMLLISACLAYPAPGRQKLLGTLAGYCLIFGLNLVRIVVLFILGQEGARGAFEFVHTYVAQFVVIALSMVFWIYWAGRQQPLRT